MSHTDNKPCIVCEPPIGPRTTQKVIELAQLCLRFGRVERVTYHEDGKRLETDTDHTVMLAVIACAFVERINAEAGRFPRYDVGLVAQFAIVHDLVEAYAGDTNTLAGTGDTAKEAREAAALARIRSEFAVDFPWLTDTIDEYESLVSPEARFVKALDKVLPKITHLLNGGATLRQHGVDASNIDAVNGSQVAKMRATYAADQPAVMALYADVHVRLREALVKQDAQPVSDATNEREATDERIDAHGCSLPGFTCAAMNDPTGRRGIWFRTLDDGIEIRAGREGDDVHVILRDGHVMTREQRLELQAALGTGAWMLEEAKHGTDIAKQNAALRECVIYARSKRGKDFDFDTWEAMCETAMAGASAPSALENEIALHAQTRDALIAVRKERDALLVDTCHGASCGKCLNCRTKAASAR